MKSLEQHEEKQQRYEKIIRHEPVDETVLKDEKSCESEVSYSGTGKGGTAPPPMIYTIDFYIHRNSRKRGVRWGGGCLKFSNGYLNACFGWSSLKL